MEININRDEIHITKLLLDSENPRHDVKKNQPEIIKQLIETEQVVNLAKDIATQGSLNPLETVGVLPIHNSEEYIVIEGNRRVCACLLLNNPDLCPNDRLLKRFRQLQQNGSVPVEIECVLFESRESADHWMQLRHEGQQEGIGTKRWDAKQKARHAVKRGRKNPNIQATVLLDYAVSQNIINDEDKDNLKVTTLQRYLNNPIVKNVFGFDDRESLNSRQDKDTFRELVQRFLDDAKDPDLISSRSKKEDWVDYANTLSSEVAPPPPTTDPVTDFSLEASKVKSGIIKSRPNPAKRKYIIPYDVKFSIKNRTLNRVYIEMQKLKIEGFEFSVAYLFRAFIEGLSVLYLKKYLPGKLNKDTQLHQKIKFVSEHLKENGVKDSKLRPLNIAASSENSLLSPRMLGSMIHLSIIPVKSELISIWDRMEDILQIINKKL